jgi:hypothetical protein
MNTYTIRHVNAAFRWDGIEKAEINLSPWQAYPEGISACAQLVYNKENLFIRLSAREEAALARFDGLLDMVCNDSCLEFFFSPLQDSPYFNFEFNPKGAVYLGFGTDRYHSVRQIVPDYFKFFSVAPFTIEHGWGVEFTIPFSFLNLYLPSFNPEKGKRFRGNFYKCGNETRAPHYLTWNPVVSDKPDFHRPECFGILILG